MITGSTGLVGLIALTLNGGDGNDLLTGGDGIDVINGGNDNDTIIGGRGADLQFGDDGDDLFVWNNGDGPDDNTGGIGTDTFTFNGADGADDDLQVVAGPGDGSLIGADFNLQRFAPTAFFIENATIEVVNVNTLAGADNILIEPSATLDINVDGGDPVTFPGDRLTLDLAGVTGANVTGTGPGAGTFSFTSGENNINYISVEALDAVNGTFSVAPINTGAGDDDILLSRDGGDTVVSVGGTEIFRAAFAAIAGGLTINGEGGNDTLTVDFTGGPVIPDGGLIFDGGVQTTSDGMILQGGGLFDTVHHTFNSENDGTIAISTENLITYTGLEPIVDNLDVANRDFTFTAVITNGTLDPSPVTPATHTRIDSNMSELVDFTTPTASLDIFLANGGSNTFTVNNTAEDWTTPINRIDLGDGGDTINFESTDNPIAPVASSPWTVLGDVGDDTLNISPIGMNLDNVQFDDGITFLGGGGTNDTVNIDDTANAFNDVYTVTSTTIDRPTWGDSADPGLTYDAAVEVINLNVGGLAAGGDTINVVSTSATATTTINAGVGNDIFNIDASALGGTNNFNGNDNDDHFNVNLTAAGGISATLNIDGNANDFGGGFGGRDEVEINDVAAIARAATITYPTTGVGATTVTGLGSTLSASGVETIDYDGAGATDSVTVIGTVANDDLLAVAPISGSRVIVFNGGNPFDGPPEIFGTSLPGVSGGSTLPDLDIDGVTQTTGFRVDEANANTTTGDKLFIYGQSETGLSDGNAADPFGFGAGLILPVVAVPESRDNIAVTDTMTQIVGNNGVGTTLVRANYDTVDFVQANPMVDPGVIVNAGEETTNPTAPPPAADSDVITLSLSTAYRFQINGGDPDPATTGVMPPIGDELILPGTFDVVNVFSNKGVAGGAPSVTIEFPGTGFQGFGFSSIEQLPVFNATTVNLIGDNNDPAIDQNDNFVVVGRDVDGDVTDGGFREFALIINGSSTDANGVGLLRFNDVQFLNVFGDDQNPPPGTPSAAPDIDTLEITPYADDTPRGWGIDVSFDEGNPPGADGDQADLIILHTAVLGGAVSEHIEVKPSGPDTGEIVVTNSSDGSLIVDIDYVANTDIIIIDDDGFANDTDTVTLSGTNGTTPATSGNETFVTDFDAAGAVATPQVVVTDTNSGTILYRVRSVTGIEQINYAGGDGNDTFNFASPTAAVYANGVEQLNVSGGLGNDAVAYNVTGRGVGSGVALNFDGGAGADAITALGASLVTPLASITYNVGPNAGEGQVILNDGVAPPVTIDFQNLEPATLLIPTANLIINATASANAISYSQSPVNAAWGRVTVDGFELMDFANAATLTINGGAGSDEISLNNAATPTGLTAITVNGGDPTAGSDVAIVSGTPGADAINFAPTTDDDAVITGAGPVTITLATIERAVIDGQGGADTLTYTTPAGNDVLTVSPAGNGSSGSVAGVRGIGGVLMPLSFDNIFAGAAANLTFAEVGGGTTDNLTVVGTASDDTFSLTAAGVITTMDSVNDLVTPRIATPGVASLILQGLSGNDTFNIPGNHSLTTLVVQGGNPDTGSDVINFTATGNTIIDLGNSTIDDDGVNPPADVTYSGTETINVIGAAFNLTTVGTVNDDVIEYTPQGAASGRVHANGVAPVVNFSNVGVFTISALGTVGDVVVVNGTSNHDTITVDSPTRTVSVTNAAGTALMPVVLNNDVEQVKVLAGLGNDTIVVVPGAPVGASTAAPQSLPTNLLIEVDGGPPGASDALVIAGNAAGAPLPAGDFVVHAKGRSADEGRIRVFRAAAPLPDISYTNIEVVSPNIAAANLMQMGPDLFEQNESIQNAAHLGSFDTVNLENLAIFPDVNEHPFVPTDTDFFEVIAKHTGTLDVQILFNTFAAALLPGGGDLDLRVLDGNGTIIAGPGSPALNAIFGVQNAANPTAVPPVAAGNNPDERLRVPVIAGQTYYVQVLQGVAAAARFNTNGYDLTITNTPAAIPYDLELNDALVTGALVAPAPAIVGANTTFTIPAAGLNPTPGFYVGKTIHFLTGANAGLSLPIVTQGPALTLLSVPTVGLRGTIAAADAFLIESTDTGRSQNDNVTNDSRPLILFRLDDDILQNDVPGNPAPGGPTPDQVTRIPWNNTFTAVAGPSTAAVAGDPAAFVAGSVTGQTAGYRVAVYEEGTTTTPGGPGPNGLWGYATMIAPGVYQFDFANTTTNNLFGAATLTNGSHFLTARVEIIDAAAIVGPANIQAPGGRSQSLEIFVDTGLPPIAFGNLVSAIDGLHPASDSSVVGIAGSETDRVTNDTTPTFWGTAEANTIVRAYLDVDASGTITGPDILLGQSVAVPTDGTNQAPFGQWEITSSVDMNDPVVLTALASAKDGLRQILISAEDPAGNKALPAGAATTPQQVLPIFIDTQGPQIVDPDGAGGTLQAIQIANAAPAGPGNGINTYNLFTGKSLAAAIAPTPLVNGLVINIRDLPNRVPAFIYNAIQNPATAGPIIAPLASVAPNAGAAAIAALAPLPIPAGAVALNPADFSVVGDANGAAPILSAYFVPTTGAIPPAAPATGYIVLTFRSATAGATLPDDRYSLHVSDTLLDPAGNRLDGENNGINVLTGNGQPQGSFDARFTVDSRPEAATFGQGGIFVDANGNWSFDPNNVDVANRDLTFNIGIDTDFIFAGKLSANQVTNGYDKLGGYGLLGGAFRWLLDTTDNGVADTVIPQPTGFAVSGIPFTGGGIPFAGNFTGAVTSADEIGIFDGVNWFLDTNHNNVIDPADTAFAGALRGYPIAGDFDGDGLADLATHFSSSNTFMFNYGSAGLNGNVNATITYGFSGVLERPVAGDTNLDGITDIGLGVPNQDGLASGSAMSWYVLQSVGAPAPGTNTNLNHPFSSVPVGNDLFQRFGNNIAVPLLGNFDPPPVPGTVNTAPVIQAATQVATSAAQLSAAFDVSISDVDGDTVSTSATADSLAWYLDQKLGLKTNGNLFEDYFGANEKWILDADNDWYYITETGGLYEWNGRGLQGTLVATFDASFHADPSRLYDAQRTTVPVQVNMANDQVTVTRSPGFDQPYVVTVTGNDGVDSVEASIMVESVTSTAIRLDAELGLTSTGNTWENWGGAGEKWLKGSDGQWYFIKPDGSLTVWDRVAASATGTVIAQLDPIFHQKPELLWKANEIALDDEFNFRAAGSQFYNWGGREERWFRGEDNGWFFIVPTGDVYRWNGSRQAEGDVVGTVDSANHQFPQQLYSAVDSVFEDWAKLMNF
ncbi:MAG: hypothetical protein R3C59_26690 [Planctomycetaceae bacterium]